MKNREKVKLDYTQMLGGEVSSQAWTGNRWVYAKKMPLFAYIDLFILQQKCQYYEN